MTNLLCRGWHFLLSLSFVLVATTALAQTPASDQPRPSQSNPTAEAQAAGSQAKVGPSEAGQTGQAGQTEQTKPTESPASGQSEQTDKAQPSQPSESGQTGQTDKTQPAQPASGQTDKAQPDQSPASGQTGQAGQTDKAQPAQAPASGQQQPAPADAQPNGAPGATPKDGASAPDDSSQKHQTKRIFWILPNNRAVSADTQLPPLTAKGKLWLAAKDSFDYSSFLNVSILAAIGLAHNSTPEFHEGLKGYATYFWHSWLDLADGNFMTEGVFPALFHQDPRFYTLGHGSFVHRAGYAASRIFVTRTDSGKPIFNFAEITGNGVAAGVSALYYPETDRNLPTVGKNWATQVGLDMLSFIFKEFWPDINHKLFHGRY
jgi:hypothetical protein